ncbi:MAG: hypothetical protein JWO41_709 [Candidatus Saccharibacteria bacterium]|nr:hypothetical protein [Candidatus Saccharibacteria bacterium]
MTTPEEPTLPNIDPEVVESFDDTSEAILAETPIVDEPKTKGQLDPRVQMFEALGNSRFAPEVIGRVALRFAESTRRAIDGESWLAKLAIRLQEHNQDTEAKLAVDKFKNDQRKEEAFAEWRSLRGERLAKKREKAILSDTAKVIDSAGDDVKRYY